MDSLLTWVVAVPSKKYLHHMVPANTVSSRDSISGFDWYTPVCMSGYGPYLFIFRNRVSHIVWYIAVCTVRTPKTESNSNIRAASNTVQLVLCGAVTQSLLHIPVAETRQTPGHSIQYRFVLCGAAGCISGCGISVVPRYVMYTQCIFQETV